MINDMQITEETPIQKYLHSFNWPDSSQEYFGCFTQKSSKQRLSKIYEWMLF